MTTNLAPGVYFEWADTSDTAVSALRTDIAAFVGIADRGPLNLPVRIGSWLQFQSTFGDLIPNGYLAYAVRAFFANGGDTCYVVRVAAPAARTQSSGAQPADGSSSTVLSTAGFASGAAVTVSQTARATTTAAPQPADRSASLVDSAGAFPPGALVTVTQAGLSMQRIVIGVDSGRNLLVWNEPLDAAYNLAAPISFVTTRQSDHLLRDVNEAGQQLIWEHPLEAGRGFDLAQVAANPLTFAAGACPAAGDLLDARAVPTLRVDAANPGAWGDGLAVRVARTNPSAASTAGAQPPDRLSSYLASVSGLRPYDLVRVYQTAAPNPIVDYRLVRSIDPATGRVFWDSALDPAYDLTQPLSIETIDFALTVYEGGRPMEIFSGLSMVPQSAGYAPIAISSTLISVTDLASPSPLPDRLPDPEALNLRGGQLSLAGGRDGIAAITPRDVIGDAASPGIGLRTLEDVPEVSILTIPDILIQPVPPQETSPLPAPVPDPCLPGTAPAEPAPPPVPRILERSPLFSLDDIARMQAAMIAHCDLVRYRVALLDVPQQPGKAGVLDVGQVQSWRQRFDSTRAALYYPWLLVDDPLRLNNQVVRPLPPGGHVAGAYAWTDLTYGVHRAPANVELRGAQAVTAEVPPAVQALLNPQGINCIRTFPGRGIRVYGARTVSGDPLWRFVPVRRLLLMIEKSVEFAVQWSVFEPNNLSLRGLLTMVISNFLETIRLAGGLAGDTAEQAYVVTCDDDTNPRGTADLGQLIALVGVAPVTPAEFVFFRIGRTGDALEVLE